MAGAQEVIGSSNGADYVFEDGYRLAPLDEDMCVACFVLRMFFSFAAMAHGQYSLHLCGGGSEVVSDGGPVLSAFAADSQDEGG